MAVDDGLRLEGDDIGYVNAFTYLGITLTTTGSSFRKHVTERVRKTTIAMADIADPQKLSVETALILFSLKLAPVATYGLELVWNDLSTADLRLSDSAKTGFLKKVLGLHPSAKNRLVYLLAQAPTLVEEARAAHRLSETAAFTEFFGEIERKRAEVDADFYGTPAMQDDSWRGTNIKNRHLVIRFSTHGFDHAVYTKVHFHDADRDCRCKFCSQECSKYHAGECVLVRSLGQLSR